MLAPEWERIKAVFESALNVGEGERDAWLERACADSPEIRATVAELISNHAAAGRFLEQVSAPVGHAFSEGELIGTRFRIVRFISRGGMGEVYEAYDEKLRVRRALKTLRPQLAGDSAALERFQREILVAHEVSHESLCRVFDLVEHRDGDRIIPCLSMQLIEGESLLALLERERPLPIETALPLIRQIAGAIDVLHRNGIIHRDLKPSNVMLTRRRDGELLAIVTDFGLAKALEARSDVFESRLDFQAGAPYFMAPEVLRGSRPGAASDIYSLGLLIDEMVTASRAFPSGSIQSLYYDKLWGAPIDPSARSPDLPAHWERVILKCLDSSPEKRYVCAADVVGELEGGGEAPALSAVRPSRLALVRRPALIRALLAICFAAVCLALIASMSRSLNTSVMVFPIDNLTRLPEYDYLCRGTTAEVLRRMTLLQGVRVIPYYESRARAPRTIKDAQFSLEGLLQVAGGRVRLTAQLTDNRDGALIWSQDFDKEMSNPLDLQSDIANGSVGAMEARTFFGYSGGMAEAGLSFVRPLRRLLGLQSAAVPRPATASNAAFDYYMRGRSLLDERTVPATLSAIQSFRSALVEDPSFALAEAALSDAQFPLMDYDYAPTAELLSQARQYAGKAVQLGPDIAETYTSLAAVQQTEWDFAGAEQSYKEALRLNPNSSRTHRWYAGLILQSGRFDEALREAQRAGALDPYDFPGEVAHALYLFFARNNSEAMKRLENVLTRKDLVLAHAQLSDIYVELALHAPEARSGYLAKALEQADAVERRVRASASQAPAPRGPISIRFADRLHAEIYSLSGNTLAAQGSIGRLASDAETGRSSVVPLAMAYSVIGERGKALDLLEKAAAKKDRQLLYIKVAPQFDAVRGTDRFRALVTRIGL